MCNRDQTLRMQTSRTHQARMSRRFLKQQTQYELRLSLLDSHMSLTSRIRHTLITHTSRTHHAHITHTPRTHPPLTPPTLPPLLSLLLSIPLPHHILLLLSSLLPHIPLSVSYTTLIIPPNVLYITYTLQSFYYTTHQRYTS